MQNPANKNSYDEAKKSAKEFYKTIDCAWCPALNDYIVFNQSGFQHLMRKRGRSRSKKEQKRRFALLLFVENIIRDKNITVQHEKNNILHSAKIGSKRIFKTTMAKFWRITAKRNGKIVKIVIRQIGNHGKHFFSVF